MTGSHVGVRCVACALGLSTLLGCDSDDNDVVPPNDASADVRAEGPGPNACQVVSENTNGNTWRGTYWIDSSGRLHTSDYVYEFDPQDRVTKIVAPAADGTETLILRRTYDEKGNPTHADAFFAGKPTTTDYKNTYDEQGRLVRVDWGDSFETFAYDDAANPTLWTSWSGGYERLLENGRPISSRRPDGIIVYTFTYDAERLVKLEYDGPWPLGPPANGSTDKHWIWSYAADGTLESVTVAWLAPFEPGATTERYSGDCKPLVDRFPWLFGIPSVNDSYMPYRERPGARYP